MIEDPCRRNGVLCSHYQLVWRAQVEIGCRHRGVIQDGGISAGEYVSAIYVDLEGRIPISIKKNGLIAENFKNFPEQVVAAGPRSPIGVLNNFGLGSSCKDSGGGVDSNVTNPIHNVTDVVRLNKYSTVSGIDEKGDK